MRTPKLLIYVTALLLVVSAGQAKEGEAPAAEPVEAAAAAGPDDAPTETPTSTGDAEATPAAAETPEAEPTGMHAPEADAAMAATEMGEAVEPPASGPVVESEGLEKAEAPTAEQGVEASSEQATAAISGEASGPMAPIGELEGPTRIQLGAIGYDDQGRPGRIHVVRRGDTLWFISDAYLGTPWVWPSIWQDNRDIENPHLIFPGDHIWITPTEMRKVTPKEAEAMLANARDADDLLEPADQGLSDVVIPGPAQAIVPTEQPSFRVADRERVGLVSAEAVDGAASILANTAPRLMISQSDRVYVSLGAGEAVEGDQFTVYRVGSKVFDPETNRMLGYHVDFLGWVEVLEVDAEASLVEVKESASEMAKGDKLMARREPIRDIPLVPAPTGIEGQISFTPNRRREMGTMDYVYLNRGTQDGVEVGSPLFVYRKGFPASDTVTGSQRQVPDRVVADLVVVRSEPEASVALVRHTEEELTRGDYFRATE